MEQRCSTQTITRITSVQKYTGRNTFGQESELPKAQSRQRIDETHDMTHPDGVPIPRRRWRDDDPEPTNIGLLSPEDLGKRIVIRSGDFLGTVYGTLLGVTPHPNLLHFTSVQLYGKKELTFRSDTEVIVLDF